MNLSSGCQLETMDSEMKVSQGIRLLRLVRKESITVKEAVDIIGLVTAVHDIQRKILEEAEREGLIRREDGKVVILERDLAEHGYDCPGIKKIECEDRCIRCGRRITSCHYIMLPDTEIGPLGSVCMGKMGIEEK